MNLTKLQDADQYGEGHCVRAVRDLVLEAATSAIPLAGLLEMAWDAGYAAREKEVRQFMSRPQPAREVKMLARGVLAAHAQRLGDQALANMAHAEWKWDDENAGWMPEGSDTTLKPSKDGRALILLEAGGEWSGTVITQAGSFDFPDGTFGA